MLLVAVAAHAQSDRQSIRKGNGQYRKQQWAQAEVAYRKALAANGSNPQALYNLGCALMQQQKDSAAIEMYTKASKVETNRFRRSMVFHNIGEICQRNKMYADAINAYAQALRDNPTDDETRYNLALCKWLNKKNPQQQNQDKNKQDKNKQNQDKDQQKDKQKDKDKDKDKQQQQEPKDKMSKENAEQLLNAAIQNEKATQQRMKKAMQQPQRRNVEKNW